MRLRELQENMMWIVWKVVRIRKSKKHNTITSASVRNDYYAEESVEGYMISKCDTTVLN